MICLGDDVRLPVAMSARASNIVPEGAARPASPPNRPFRKPRTARRLALPAVISSLCLLLSGCALIDQETFASSPEAPPPVAAAPAPPPVPVDPRRPLLVIDYATPEPNYDEPLRYAIRSAEIRDRRVQYDVIAVAPTMNQATATQEQAVAVMRAIMGSRVPASRIHLGLRAEPWQSAIQVRVYVR